MLTAPAAPAASEPECSSVRAAWRASASLDAASLDAASLDAAYDAAVEKGNPPAALLVSSPNNPLGALPPLSPPPCVYIDPPIHMRGSLYIYFQKYLK